MGIYNELPVYKARYDLLAGINRPIVGLKNK
jgi:hypothetical protein